MFERFTGRARRVLVVAQDEARSLNHRFIGPEHLLLGLVQGDGVAARALRELGVSIDETRAKVTSSMERVAESHTDGAKVPFSPPAKKALEMSLREALQLGHNYIGTEHLLLGLLRVSKGDEGAVQLVGLDPDTVRERVLEVLRKGPPSSSPQSLAAVVAMRRARQLAGAEPMTTGHLLLAVLSDDSSQASQALNAMGITHESLATELAQTPVSGTTDSPPRPRAIEIKLGEATLTIEDPDLAAALADLTPEQLRTALREASDPKPKRRRPGSGD